MPGICQQCGSAQEANADFCKNCGTRLIDGAQSGGTSGGVAAGGAPSLPGLQLVGFSSRVDDPVFTKLKRARIFKGLIIWLIALPVVVLVFQIIAFFTDSLTPLAALTISCLVVGVGLIWTVADSVKRALAPTWEGEVADKKITQRTVSDQDGNRSTYYYHTIMFNLTRGGRKKMRKRRSSPAPGAWDMMAYLDSGDLVRYHGKLDYYEKYDKTHDTEVPCAKCRKFVDIHLDSCPHCHVPIIKP